MSRAYRLALFDFDGTLADSFPWFARTVNDAADKFRFRRIEPHEFDELRGRGAREIVRHLGVPLWKVPRIANWMRKRVANELDQIRLFEGAGDALLTLADNGVTAGIVTSNTESNVRRVLGPQLAAAVSHYYCGASLFGKAAKFRSALRETRVAPSETIAIGDEIRDIEAARAAGIAIGAVGWGYTTREALRAHGPDAMFDHFGEICVKLCGAAAEGQQPSGDPRRHAR